MRLVILSYITTKQHNSLIQCKYHPQLLIDSLHNLIEMQYLSSACTLPCKKLFSNFYLHINRLELCFLIMLCFYSSCSNCCDHYSNTYTVVALRNSYSDLAQWY